MNRIYDLLANIDLDFDNFIRRKDRLSFLPGWKMWKKAEKNYKRAKTKKRWIIIPLISRSI